VPAEEAGQRPRAQSRGLVRSHASHLLSHPSQLRRTLRPMSGSVRERRPGVWELRPYLGRDPLRSRADRALLRTIHQPSGWPGFDPGCCPTDRRPGGGTRHHARAGTRVG
jgi:hypothetical protein